MSEQKPVQDFDKFVVRLPDGMRDRLKAAAEANKRSMNAEIIARLEDSFSDFGRDAWRARADKQDERLDNLEAFLRSNGKVPLIED